MVPNKKRVPTRKRLLDVEANEAPASSAFQSAWQAKYQLLETAYDFVASENGSADAISSTTPTCTVSGLVGDYDSDSETEQSEPVASTSQIGDSTQTQKYQVPGLAWTQCVDESTGYPYYWNQLTNEVSWQPPPEFIAAMQAMQSRQLNAAFVDTKLKVKATVKIESKEKKSSASSESEEETIQMITSFGPQSGDESDEELKRPAKRKNRREKVKDTTVFGPQLPVEMVIQGPMPSDDVQDVYETSSLMAPLVADTGPPGAEPLKDNLLVNGCDLNDQGIAGPSKSAAKTNIVSLVNSSDSDDSDVDDILTRLKSKSNIRINSEGEKSPDNTKEVECSKSPVAMNCENVVSGNNNPNVGVSSDIADDIIAQIEKEMPPDYIPAKRKKVSNEKKTNSFALIASYGDDSDTEESPRKTSKEAKPLFPIAAFLEETKPTPVFPCVSAVSRTPSPPAAIPIIDCVPLVECAPKTENASLAESAPSLVDPNLPDSTTTYKAFKRKKRLDVGAVNYGASTSSGEPSAEVAAPVQESNPFYNMDPSSGEHRGFGFNKLCNNQSNFVSTYGIKFIKAETINMPPAKNEEVKESIKRPQDMDPVASKEMESDASRLMDKLSFLGAGKDAVSAVHLMAIQLETLLSAWQAGALTPTYLTQWLEQMGAEITEKEQAAAPEGWTCTWDRETKRYFYRNMEDGSVVWEYPELSSKAPPPAANTPSPVEDEDVAMELGETPPHVSPAPDSVPERDPTPPPPPIISRSLTPPPPPIISVQLQSTSTTKRNFDEVSSSTEGKKSGQVIPLPPKEEYPPQPSEPEEPPPPGVDDADFLYLPSSSQQPQLPQGPPDSSSHVDYNAYQPSGISSSSNSEVSTSYLLKPSQNLLSELDSFYSDIAKLECGSVSTSEVPVNPPVMPDDAAASWVASTSSAQSYSKSDSTTSSVKASSSAIPSTSDQAGKKKKKTVKLTAGLTLKKKGVPSMVAKWQQVQDEARRKYGSDDEDDVSSTHK